MNERSIKNVIKYLESQKKLSEADAHVSGDVESLIFHTAYIDVYEAIINRLNNALNCDLKQDPSAYLDGMMEALQDVIYKIKEES